MEKRCISCGSPNNKLILAGVSRKTGKHYDAFYSCSDCGKTESTISRPTPRRASGSHPSAKNDEKFESIMTYLEQILITVQDIKEKLK